MTQWEDRKPETDAGEHEGEEDGLLEEDKRAQRVDSEGGGKYDRKGAHRGGMPDNYELKSPGSNPVGGPKRATTTRDARARRSQKRQR